LKFEIFVLLQARIEEDETQDLELLDSLLGHHFGVFSFAKEFELSTLAFDPNCELRILWELFGYFAMPVAFLKLTQLIPALFPTS
jgi:hypothetical protein